MRKYLRSRRKLKEKKIKLEIDENPKETTSIVCNLVLCRICESTDELIDISTEVNAHYLEKLHQIFPAASTDETKDDQSDQLLKFVCRPCGAKLEDLTAFRVQCEVTHKKLLEELSRRENQNDLDTTRKLRSLKPVLNKGDKKIIAESSLVQELCLKDETENTEIECDFNDWTEVQTDIEIQKCEAQSSEELPCDNEPEDDLNEPEPGALEEQSGDKKKWLECRICKLKVKNRYHMEKHMWNHKGRSLMCRFCNVVYSCQGNLTRHIRVVHEKKLDYVCKLCDKKFSQSNNLKLHMITHTDMKFECDVCKRLFKNPRSLRNHKQEHLPLEQQNKQSDHVQKQAAKRSSIKWKQCQKRTCICQICGKVSNYSTLHESHMRSHTGEKPFKCNECDKSFRERSSLRSHMLVHTGAKPYVCSNCGAAFRQGAHLRRHMRSHTGEKPYKCKVCEKSFTERSILTTHLRVHTGEQPFHCQICPKKFHNPRVLRRHYPKVHFKHLNIHTQRDIQQQLAAMQIEREFSTEENN
ncbi:zinc finger protein 37-like [Phlebotomus papatasi]|nr:zinc finger protein 37-like [Phlebotomus papatasi]